VVVVRCGRCTVVIFPALQNVYVYYIIRLMHMSQEKIPSGKITSNSDGDRVVILTFYVTSNR
jgi:hypothetical protein